jgi:hypothetical protein
MAVRPAAGEVLEQTTRTRLLTKEEHNDKEPRPELWEFVDSLTPTTPSDPDYEFTLYRGRKVQKSEEKSWIGKFYEPMTPSRIQAMFGGGEYNVWLKVRVGNGKALTLRWNEDLKIEGLPKTPAEVSAAPAAGDATSQIIAMFREEMRSLRDELKVMRGGDAGVRAVEQAVTLSGQVFGSAATAAVGTLQNIASRGADGHQTNPMEGLMTQFMTAAIAKMLNPADPIENFSKMVAAMSGLGMKVGGGGGEGKLIDKLAIGLVDKLPALAQYGAQIMAQYRAAEEAKVHQAAIIRGVPPPVPAQIPPPPSNVVVMPSPEAPPAPMNQEQQMQQAEQMLQYIERKLVELLADESISPEQAAGDALTFIDVTDPVNAHPDKKNLVDQVIAHGEAGLRWVFTNRPILQQVPQGPRLDAFIKTFVEEGNRPPTMAVQKPNPQAPPA